MLKLKIFMCKLSVLTILKLGTKHSLIIQLNPIISVQSLPYKLNEIIGLQ